MAPKIFHPDKINVITLGCSKNLVDSEVLMEQIRSAGVEVLHNSKYSDAKTVIINTCGFIKDAKTESIETILSAIRAKEEGLVDKVYVMGCLSERYKKDLEKEIKEVDQYFGVNDLQQILKSLAIDYRKELLGERKLTSPGHYAYLKISEGCDRSCSFCAIPLIRGKHISRPMEKILLEARSLATKGVKEIILIAQDLSYYGLDLYKKRMLYELLTQLSALEGIEWIRLHYVYPTDFPLEILPLMASDPKICNYIDIPLQHISDPVLKLMRRKSNTQQIKKLLQIFRKDVPGVALRTTLLVGHPGEGKKEFNELKKFVAETAFDRLGVFTYSHEENTYGFDHFKDTIPGKVKQERADEIMQIQQKISEQLNNEKKGRVLKILIDREEGDFYVGRSEFDSPEVDQEVLINKSKNQLKIGMFYQVEITGANDYDLFGRLHNE